MEISANKESLRFSAGERIFKQGDLGDFAFLLLEGRVSLFQYHDGQRIEVNEIGPGEIFGEMAVMDGGSRSTTAVAIDDCAVAILTAQDFSRRLGESDPFVRALVDQFIKSIRNSPRLFLRRPRSFRDHVKQMTVFSWNLRRFAGRMDDPVMADDVLDVLDRLDIVLTDLSNVAELCPDNRHDLIIEEELNGVDFADVIGTEGQRQL